MTCRPSRIGIAPPSTGAGRGEAAYFVGDSSRIVTAPPQRSGQGGRPASPHPPGPRKNRATYDGGLRRGPAPRSPPTAVPPPPFPPPPGVPWPDDAAPPTSPPRRGAVAPRGIATPTRQFHAHRALAQHTHASARRAHHARRRRRTDSDGLTMRQRVASRTSRPCIDLP
jgi:hypothetical protein